MCAGYVENSARRGAARRYVCESNITDFKRRHIGLMESLHDAYLFDFKKRARSRRAKVACCVLKFLILLLT